ncbi:MULTISPECIES: TVP38/TMEM64 family protein [unclassified Streptomyces]|uniref:TVP38/TMEM64 family protein n=1 Tax=unclassified Streptomyces TaxID=2593676 RepID=UPI0032220EA9
MTSATGPAARPLGYCRRMLDPTTVPRAIAGPIVTRTAPALCPDTPGPFRHVGGTGPGAGGNGATAGTDAGSDTRHTADVAVPRAPWPRLAVLLVLLASAAFAAVSVGPERLLTVGPPSFQGGAAAALAYAAAYGVLTVAFVPRPLLNLGAGALLGGGLGLAAALVGTVLGAGIAFCIGRALGQDALRSLLRGRWLRAADGQLSRHGFRSVLAARLFPGVPFAVTNYCASVSRMGLTPFLLATGVGSIPNTAAYAVAGAGATAPASPTFLIALACVAVPGLAGALVAWSKRHRLRKS